MVARKMKVGIWVLADYKPRIGGGFSLYEKFIQLIDEYKFSDEIEVCFIGHRPASNFKFKKKYVCLDFLSFVLTGGSVKNGISNSLFSMLSGWVSVVSHKLPVIGDVERKILKNNAIDLIFYPVQGFKKVNNFPFVTANWDIGHKSSFAFPEISMNRKYEYREKWYAKDIFKALMIFAESKAGKEELILYTKCNPERIGIVPLFPGGVVDLKIADKEQEDILSKWNLKAYKYFFYPAQFWAHKNHYNLLKAYSKLREEFPELKLVFTGADKGNKKYIIDEVHKAGLTDHVLFTGFIENRELSTFYCNAIALVMPTFYGPTNMPLLEARELKCPVLCSDLSGHREIMGDGATYFDPMDAGGIYQAMKLMVGDEQRNAQLVKANASLAGSIFTSANAISSLEQNLIKLKPVRQTWGSNHKIF